MKMKRPTTLFLLSLMALWGVAGCQTELRRPLCTDDDQVDVPERYTGVYQLTAPEMNPVQGDISFEEIQLELKNGPDGPTIRGNGEALQVYRKTKRSGEGSLKIKTVLPLPRFNLCLVNGSYYSQSTTEKGTYTLSRVDFSDTGLTFTPISFAASELSDAGIKAIYLPNYTGGGTGIEFDMMSKKRLIVDNRHVDAERLMEKAHAVSFGGWVMNRVREEERAEVMVPLEDFE